MHISSLDGVRCCGWEAKLLRADQLSVSLLVSLILVGFHCQQQVDLNENYLCKISRFLQADSGEMRAFCPNLHTLIIPTAAAAALLVAGW